MSACWSASKPRMLDSGASAAMMLPPGTPGAATITMPSMRMKCRKRPKSQGMPCSRQMVRAQATIFMVEPDMWMVAQSGMQKPATSSETPFWIVCRRVTGIVAAELLVPNAVI